MVKMRVFLMPTIKWWKARLRLQQGKPWYKPRTLAMMAGWFTPKIPISKLKTSAIKAVKSPQLINSTSAPCRSITALAPCLPTAKQTSNWQACWTTKAVRSPHWINWTCTVQVWTTAQAVFTQQHKAWAFSLLACWTIPMVTLAPKNNWRFKPKAYTTNVWTKQPNKQYWQVKASAWMWLACWATVVIFTVRPMPISTAQVWIMTTVICLPMASWQ